MFSYSAFGLHFLSEIDFSQIFLSNPSFIEDSLTVTVRFGSVPDGLPDAKIVAILYQISTDQFWFEVPHIARYWVKQGREIIIQPSEGADEDSVIVFFLNTALSALMHQRQIAHLRANAVETPAGALLFTGDSGTGKSTLTALFQQNGFRVICDDITSLMFDEQGEAYVVPGSPTLKLWRSALDGMAGIDRAQLRRIRPGIERYNFPVGDRFCAEPQLLRKIYFLGYLNRDDYALQPISMIAQLPALLTQVYQQRIAVGMGVMPTYWKPLASLVGKIPITRLSRPSVGGDFDRLFALVRADESDS